MKSQLAAIVLACILLVSFTACGDTTETYTVVSTELLSTTYTLTNAIVDFSWADDSPHAISENQAVIVILFDGYGYKYGDILLLDIKSSPKIGDIVMYNRDINKSSAYSYGPSLVPTEITGMPGDNVTFKEWSFLVNRMEIAILFYVGPPTKNVLWGSTAYDNVEGLTLAVPDGEYLGDGFIGKESYKPVCTTTDYMGHNRFTVKKEAVIGIVLGKVGHQNIAQVTW
jgi:hypothetical protein